MEGLSGARSAPAKIRKNVAQSKFPAGQNWLLRKPFDSAQAFLIAIDIPEREKFPLIKKVYVDWKVYKYC